MCLKTQLPGAVGHKPDAAAVLMCEGIVIEFFGLRHALCGIRREDVGLDVNSLQKLIV